MQWRDPIWRAKAIVEQLLDRQVVLRTMLFNPEFLLVQSHFLNQHE